MNTGLHSFLRRLEKIVRPVSRISNYVSLALLGIMPLPVFFDVLARFLFKGAVPGTIEIEGFMLLIIVFLGLAFTQISEGHIRIDLLISKFPKWAQDITDCSTYLISTFFFFLMSSQLFTKGIKKIMDHETTYDLHIPTYIFWFIAGLGAILLALALLLHFLQSLQRSLESARKRWLLAALVLSCFLMIAPMLGFAPSNLNGSTAGFLGMILLFIFLFLGMPIGFGMAFTGFLGMIVVYKGVGPSLAMLAIGPYSTAASYMLTVVPLFILMGELAYYSGISKDLFQTASIWLGRLRGGLAMASVAGCAGFAAVCGDSLATAVTMGTLAVPEMKKKKYGMSLATGCLAAGGTLGILIPPSVGFIFYAIVTEESIGRLFIAGLIPGLLLATMFIVSIFLLAKVRPEMAPRGEASSFKQKLISLKGVIAMLLLFILILGGILAGIFSPVEGGAIGAVGAFVYAFVRRRVTKRMIVSSLQDTLKITTKLLMILIGVGILGYFLAATRLPFILATFVTEM